VYTARLAREPVARSDVAEVRWFPWDRLPWREIAFPSVSQALRRFRATR
jgi:hypothetical protein